MGPIIPDRPEIQTNIATMTEVQRELAAENESNESAVPQECKVFLVIWSCAKLSALDSYDPSLLLRRRRAC